VPVRELQARGRRAELFETLAQARGKSPPSALQEVVRILQEELDVVLKDAVAMTELSRVTGLRAGV